MKQEHLGDGAYVTVNRDFVGQVIFTADHHDDHMATSRIYLDYAALQKALKIYDADIQENHI